MSYAADHVIDNGSTKGLVCEHNNFKLEKQTVKKINNNFYLSIL